MQAFADGENQSWQKRHTLREGRESLPLYGAENIT